MQISKLMKQTRLRKCFDVNWNHTSKKDCNLIPYILYRVGQKPIKLKFQIQLTISTNNKCHLHGPDIDGEH